MYLNHTKRCSDWDCKNFKIIHKYTCVRWCKVRVGAGFEMKKEMKITTKENKKFNKQLK